MSGHAPLRSVLFVPADRARAVEKAAGLGADALILDLEDAIAPEAKSAARQAAAGALESWRGAGGVRAVRINALGTDGFEADAAACAYIAPDAVVIPKVEGAAGLMAAREALDEGGYRGPVWAMIETPLAVLRLAEIAAAAEDARLQVLIAGTNDLSALLRLPPEGARAAMAPHLAAIVLAARACGAAALDGVFNAHTDADGFAAEARAGRAMGFDGKTLIHPYQVGPANAAFAPTEAELDWARAVEAAFADPANAGKGAIPVRGEMAERLHLDRARAMLKAAQS